MDQAITAPREELFGHPKGLYVCFATELWGALFVLRHEVSCCCFT